MFSKSNPWGPKPHNFGKYPFHKGVGAILIAYFAKELKQAFAEGHVCTKFKGNLIKIAMVRTGIITIHLKIP